jgi:hypothetical protein
MKRLLAIALVTGAAAAGTAEAQMAPQDELTRMDAAVTQALMSGDHAAASKMLDDEFSWVTPDGLYFATTAEAFRHGVKPIVGVGSGIKVLEHKYNKVVYIERSQDEKKFSGHFWVQRPEGWKLLNINEVEKRARDYKTVPITFDVPCTNPCQRLPYEPLGAGEKAAVAAWQDQENDNWAYRIADNYDQRAINTYAGRSPSKKDRMAGMAARAKAEPNLPEIGAAPVAYGRGWDFGDAVVWVQLQPTYGDKPYWSTRIYAEINGVWQMAESYHTYIKDAPVMAPVPESATKMSMN